MKYIYKKKTIAGSIVIIGFAIVFFLFNPENAGFFPPCPFTYLTGLKCPGCGSQRALHNLLHLNIEKAWILNPLLVVMLPYVLGGLYFENLGGKEKFPKTRKFFFGKTAIIIISIIIVSFWIIRNLI